MSKNASDTKTGMKFIYHGFCVSSHLQNYIDRNSNHYMTFALITKWLCGTNGSLGKTENVWEMVSMYTGVSKICINELTDRRLEKAC